MVMVGFACGCFLMVMVGLDGEHGVPAVVGASWDYVAMVAIEFACGRAATALVRAGWGCIVKAVAGLGSASWAAYHPPSHADCRPLPRL